MNLKLFVLKHRFQLLASVFLSSLLSVSSAVFGAINETAIEEATSSLWIIFPLLLAVAMVLGIWKLVKGVF